MDKIKPGKWYHMKEDISMPSFSDFTFASSTGKNHIHARQCMPDGEPRAILQIAHGIAEHIERYDDFAFFLAQNLTPFKIGFSPEIQV